MRFYVNPEIEIIEISACDVVTASAVDTTPGYTTRENETEPDWF